jgi:hypothetical protein
MLGGDRKSPPQILCCCNNFVMYWQDWWILQSIKERTLILCGHLKEVLLLLVASEKGGNWSEVRCTVLRSSLRGGNGG